MTNIFLGDMVVFLISQPRSGSTLLQRILAGHLKILASAEPWLMLHPIYALKESEISAEYNSAFARQALEDFLSHYANGSDTHDEAVRAYAEVLYRGALVMSGKSLFLDKTPRYYHIVPELHRIFPMARFIFLLRNPLAVLNSIIFTWRKENWTDLSAFRDDLMLAPAHIIDGAKLIGSNAIVLHYENLVTKPEDEVQKLCDFLDIQYTDQLLNYGERPAPLGRMGDPISIDRYQRPVNDSLNNWHRLAEHHQTRHFGLSYLQKLGPALVEEMGYSYDELYSVLADANPSSSKHIVPWELAMSPPSTWTNAERLKVERVKEIQANGEWQGLLSFLRTNHRALLRELIPPSLLALRSSR